MISSSFISLIYFFNKKGNNICDFIEIPFHCIISNFIKIILEVHFFLFLFIFYFLIGRNKFIR